MNQSKLKEWAEVQIELMDVVIDDINTEKNEKNIWVWLHKL